MHELEQCSDPCDRPQLLWLCGFCYSLICCILVYLHHCMQIMYYRIPIRHHYMQISTIVCGLDIHSS